jgi:hypothetical protein
MKATNSAFQKPLEAALHNALAHLEGQANDQSGAGAVS